MAEGVAELGSGQRMFMTGNESVAWAALAAGADFMYGYPITPQNEIMHYWSQLAPKNQKGFLQTEDEMSAGFAMLGGAVVGRKTFSATAGPGNVLMQEPISMAEMMRLPGVWIIQQRGGPSTATVIYSQQELRLTTFGGNGEGHRIVFSTCSHQELFDYTIKAFNAAWTYRFPTFVLGDGYQAKMREPVTIHDPAKRTPEPVQVVPGTPILGAEWPEGAARDPVHMRNTYNTEEELLEVLTKNQGDFDAMSPKIVEWQEDIPEGCQVVIIAHGIVARAVEAACETLRQMGIKAGRFRPITVRPFPVEALRKVAQANPQASVIVVESAIGQLLSVVKEHLYGFNLPMYSLLKPGVAITAEDVTDIAVSSVGGGKNA